MPSRPLRILHLTHQYPPDDMGGVEIYTRDMARAQAALGHDVSVIVPSQRSNCGGLIATDEAGVRIIRVPLGQRGRGKVFAATWHDPAFVAAFEARLSQIDIVHVQHLMGVPLAIFDALAARNVPYVITLHDYWFPCANAQLVTNYDNTLCAGPDAKVHNCGRCFVARTGVGDRPAVARAIAPLLRNRIKRLRQVFTNAAKVIAVSPFVQRTYAALGFAGSHVVVLQTGIELPDRLPARRTATDGPLHAIYLGSIAPPKGVHVLVQAWTGMPPDAKLTIAGGLTKFPDYVAQLKRLATHPNINFVGRVAREDVWRLLVSAEVAVLPTLWYEASPLTISEFFAAGLPIVASDIGAVGDRIRHQQDGLLFPPGDDAALKKQLLALYEDKAMVEQLRENRPKVVSMQSYTAEILSLYNDCLS